MSTTKRAARLFEVHSDQGKVHREAASSFDDLCEKIETWPTGSLVGIFGPSYLDNGRDWFVTASAKGSKPRKLHIRIDGLNKVECDEY